MNELSYVEMLQAVTNGKASAAQIADICNQYNITPEQLYTDLYKSENISFWKTSNGSVRSISAVSGQRVQAGAPSSVETAINSNAGGSAPVTFKEPVKTPVNTKLIEEAGTQKVSFDTEIAHIGGRSITDGKFSVQNVGLAMAAVGTGIKAGKAIDSILYNANPDFFDNIRWGSFNPETWASLTEGIDENDPWYVRTGANAFNAIFGFGVDDPLHPDNAQMYLDEQSIAYLIGAMADMGVFDKSTESASVTQDVFNVLPEHASIPNNVILQAQGNQFIFNTSTNQAYVIKDLDGYCFNYKVAGDGNVYGGIIACSRNPGSFTFEYWTGGTRPTTTSTESLYSTTVNGTTFYYSYMEVRSPYIQADNIVANTVGTRNNAVKSMAYIVLFGTISGGTTIEGISDADGATVFDPSTITDLTNIDEVIAALKSQLPDLFDDDSGIEQTIVDENGNEQTITYYPVPIPHINPDNINQPTGGNEYGTQNDPIVDPNTYPEELIKSITEMLLQSPTPSPNLPDTGNGNTPIVTPPAGSATALWSIYNPTQEQIDAFGAWLWSNDFVDQLKKIFNDPMESIISLHKVFGTPTTGGTRNIAVGYLNSGVSSKVVTAQYTDVDCGSVQLSEYFGNVYDYKDTSVELYLPFIGIVPLSVSDVMRATIHIVYHIDVLTGACLADVEVTRDAGAGGVLYQYSGDCAVHYPVSSGSYIGIVGGILSAGAGIAGTIASGGAAAPLVLGGASALMRMHTDVARSGGFSANAGAMGAKVPYLIINRPQTALPENYLDIEGIGSNKTVMLNTCTGYTRIKEVYLQGIGDATEGELNELETLLKAGVVFPITETPPNE